MLLRGLILVLLLASPGTKAFYPAAGLSAGAGHSAPQQCESPPPSPLSSSSSSGTSGRPLSSSSTSPLFFSSSSSSADAAAFARIANARFSNKKYKPDPIPDDVLDHLLLLSQRAPSSFNVQPYTCVVVRSEEAKKRLAGGMLGANAKSVLTAPVTVVFAADLESSRLVPKMIESHRRTGHFPEAMLKKIPFYALLFSGGHRTYLLRWLIYTAKRLLLTVVGLFQPVPRIEHPEAWAFKNVALVAQTFMLAATANGLTTCPMEGFDAWRVRSALGIPRRYGVALVVSVGYAAAAAAAAEEGGRGEEERSERFPPTEVFFWEAFGEGRRGGGAVWGEEEGESPPPSLATA